MKNNTGKKRQTSITMNPEDIKIFQKKYPNMMSVYIRKAVHLAITDYNFFVKVITIQEE